MQGTGHPVLRTRLLSLMTTGQARSGSQVILRDGKRRLEAVRRTVDDRGRAAVRLGTRLYQGSSPK